MTLVLRWGRSAYETDADLALERAAAHALKLDWLSRPEVARPAELAEAAVLVVTSGVRVDAAALDAFGGRLVLTTTSGFDHVDLDAARARGVTVARCPLARRDAVVETAIAGLLTLLREVPRLHDLSRAGRWARAELPALGPKLLRESTVVVVGSAGVIGSEACARLTGLGARVLGVDPRGAPAGVPVLPLHEALPLADAITLHCELTPETRGLLGAAALDRLPRGAVVVNTARGALLDVAATVDRIRDGRLRGALIDVFPTEPWPELVAHGAVPGVLLLPHAAGYTADLGTRVAREVAATLAAWSRGDPLPSSV